MEILNNIYSSADVKAVPKDQLPLLCSELRKEIIDTVSKNGGHLASNLGAVELTVALHRVYDSKKDRLVFDVGHQCYAHKLLTGRLEQFGTLRQKNGISGFPKPCESVDDACIAGHASASISCALGMARARSLLHEEYDICAVIGDGALTGGLAYEGLTNCAESGEPIVIILNDNGMSISENVGGLARLLSGQRIRPGYIAFKKFYRNTIGKLEPVYKVLHKIKEWVKDLCLPDNMFEDMGFYYLGPIDGHDLDALERTIRYAKEMKIPVIVHVLTAKGKGYAPAEVNPALYHGVSPFNPDYGIQAGTSNCFSEVFGSALTEMAEENSSIVAVTAAMSDGTGLNGFAAKYPARFFDVGIAEENAVTMAAGMAKQGLTPVVAIYSTFLQRGFDQMIHDVALGNLHVVFAVDRAGLVGSDGETHQGSFDVGYLCQIPGMKVLTPSNFAELRTMLSLAVSGQGPVAVRYPRGDEGAFTEDTSTQDAVILIDGSDLTVVTYGTLVNEAIAAAKSLELNGIHAQVVKLNRLDKLDIGLLAKAVSSTGKLVVAEESAEIGSVGIRILAELERRNIQLKSTRLLNLGSGVVQHGSVRDLRHDLKLDAAGISTACEEIL